MARLPFRPTRLPRPRPVPTVSPTPAPTVAPNNAFTLTTNIETLPAAGVTAAANAVFTAPAGVTPQGVQANTLQSGDVLNGSGQQNVLNATFVTNAATAPTINNIPTVNITSLAGANLNLGASTGITTIGDINSTAGVNVTGVKTALTTLNKTGGIARDTVIQSQSAVLNGANNALQINLSGVDGGNINVTPLAPSNTNGYETFNVAVTGASTVGRLIAGASLDNINVSGSALEIEGEAGFNALEPTLLSFNASAMNGPLIVGNIENGVAATEGASVVNAAAENLNFVGSNNGTVLFAESASLGQGDVLNGGTGPSTLVLTGASAGFNIVNNVNLGSFNNPVQGNNSAFTATGFETLAITDTRGNGVGERAPNNPANFNLANVSGVNTVELGTASNAVVGLTNLQYTSPLAINVIGTGESAVNAANGVSALFFGAFGDADTVNYTFSNKGRALNTNNNINNGALTLPNIENLSLTYNDLTPNTVVTNRVLGGNTDLYRFISVNSASGENDLVTNTAPTADTPDVGAINLGTVGVTVTNNAGATVITSAGNFRGATINSNASVTAAFGNRSGASYLVSGNGDHSLNIVGAGDAAINGETATGDVQFSGVYRNIATGAAAAATTIATGRLTFTSGSGDDTLIGGLGADVLTGNSGSDRLEGLEQLDVLSGGDNNDTLIGGTLNDVLTGGAGADRFEYDGLAGVAADTGITIATSDVITDFSSVAGDRIVVLGVGGSAANYGEAGPQANFVDARTAADAFFAAGTGVYFLTSSIADNTGLLFVDTLAGVVATDVIQLNGVNAANFAFTDIIA